MTKLDTLLLELEKLDGERTGGEWTQIGDTIQCNGHENKIKVYGNALNQRLSKNAAFIIVAINSNKVLREVIKIQREALEFIIVSLVPYSPDSDEGIAIERARQALEAAERVCE